MSAKKKWGSFHFPPSPLWWQFIRSRHDFLLKISPSSRYRHGEYDKSYYPPPGYGTPPGASKNPGFTPRHQYALFLYPGKLAFYFLLFSLLLPCCIFLPFWETLIQIPFTEYKTSAYAFFISLFWLVSYLFYLFLYHYIMPPVLSGVWEKWPLPANHLFLSVPHHL